MDALFLPDALLADLENTSSPLPRCPVLLTSDPPQNPDANSHDPAQTRPPPPAYTPQQVGTHAMLLSTSATMELDKLMASLSDFRVQTTPAAPVSPVVTVQQQPATPPQQPAAPPQPSSEGSLDSMLGLLQSDLSRQGVQTSSKGNCSACQKPVVGQVNTFIFISAASYTMLSCEPPD
ncbi:hypothetical protein GOODEAATRI_026701 [Goodea atripinnis]|uniref:Uncharacterized protein n=1 Tax=Goodea atripinnis TaxID=208336 RepID=A0ABV0MWU5_9TELE